jgi:tetrapyrrole methylase family protein / MazG family protein
MSTEASASFERLLSIIQRLRGPDGCPWDRQQSPRTLRPSLMEEAWECVSAIDNGDDVNLEEELGDLYLLVTMMAWMKEQEQSFSVSSTLAHIADKLVRRHPHVFGSAEATSVEQVLTQWDAIKAHEKATRGEVPRPSALDRVPRSLPPLERSAQLQKKAAKVGFDWPGPEPVWNKIDEELRELREALGSGDARRIEDEVGDLLFSVVNLSRLLEVSAETALHGTNAKFERRFRAVEKRCAALGVAPAEAGLEMLDRLWNEVKAQEADSTLPEGDPASTTK